MATALNAMRIGVLALQGAFAEHLIMLERLGVPAVPVREAERLSGLDGLILPGGESTAIGKLAAAGDLFGPLRHFCRTRPVWGVCAGMILLATDAGTAQPLLQAMDIRVERNAFGRQIASFETELIIDGLPGGTHRPFPGVFIRAPRLVGVGPKVRVLARMNDGTAVAASENRCLVTAFHPELTADDRVHRLFLEMARERPDEGFRKN